MITAERLEELIKQEGVVYFGTYNEDNVFILLEIKLEHCYILDNELHDEQECRYYDFADLFETKDRAEWHCKMDAERTERFEPPMWEDIEDEWNFYFAKGKETYHFWVEKDCVGISKCEYLCDYWSDAHKTLFEEEPTKENYIKACEIVRDLFNKGGAK